MTPHDMLQMQLEPPEDTPFPAELPEFLLSDEPKQIDRTEEYGPGFASDRSQGDDELDDTSETTIQDDLGAFSTHRYIFIVCRVAVSPTEEHCAGRDDGADSGRPHDGDGQGVHGAAPGGAGDAAVRLPRESPGVHADGLCHAGDIQNILVIDFVHSGVGGVPNPGT